MKIARLFLLLCFSLIFTACAANKSRHLPPTEPLSPRANIPPLLHNKKICISPFERHKTQVGGSHHEGLLQVRQPWMFGLPDEQKRLIYSSAAELAALSFADELKKLGLAIFLLKNSTLNKSQACHFQLSGRVQQVIINTYGNGTVEGFGSAGNYWEATVGFSNLALQEVKSEKIVWTDNIQEYVKLQGSPVKLNWTFMTLAIKSVKGALYLHQMQMVGNPLSGLSKADSYLQNWKGDYKVEKQIMTPLEIASRNAAIRFFNRVR